MNLLKDFSNFGLFAKTDFFGLKSITSLLKLYSFSFYACTSHLL